VQARDPIILAKLNRAELGDLDAIVLGLFLMAHLRDRSSSLTSVFTAARATFLWYRKEGLSLVDTKDRKISVNEAEADRVLKSSFGAISNSAASTR
jgi:hypothetical protein